MCCIFVLFISWVLRLQIHGYPYSAGLLHWHWCNGTVEIFSRCRRSNPHRNELNICPLPDLCNAKPSVDRVQNHYDKPYAKTDVTWILQLGNNQFIRSSTFIARYNTTRYCIHSCRDWGRVEITIRTHKIHPTLRPNERAMKCNLWWFGRNWPRYSGTALYNQNVCVKRLSDVLIPIYIPSYFEKWWFKP